MHDLFAEYFNALDTTIRLFGALKSALDPERERLAYAAKDSRTAILNRLMAALKKEGIDTFSEGHARFYRPE